jgi:hypothetical protein
VEIISLYGVRYQIVRVSVKATDRVGIWNGNI